MSAFAKTSIVKLDFDTDIMEGFPLMVDDTTMAFHLHIRAKTLWYLLKKRNAMTAYNCFAIPQFDSDGALKKMREIQEPMPHLKVIHSILNNLFSKIEVDPAISAYVKGRNCADAAKKHVRESYRFDENGLDGTPDRVGAEAALKEDPRYSMKRTVKHSHDPSSQKIRVYHQPMTMIKMDIKNFFPSIKASWIREFFKEEVGYSHYVASLMASLCTVKRMVKNHNKEEIEVRHLPQGSPLSGSLANLVGFHKFGKQIKEMLEKHSPDWVFTIYSDDIIVTHPSNTLTLEEAKKVKDRMIQIVTSSGFKVNSKKTLIKRSEHGDRIKILGCIVTDMINVPKETRRRLSNRIHNCLFHGFEKECAKDQTVPGLIMHFRGMIEHVRSIRPDLAIPFTRRLEEAMTAHAIEVNPTTVESTLC